MNIFFLVLLGGAVGAELRKHSLHNDINYHHDAYQPFKVSIHTRTPSAPLSSRMAAIQDNLTRLMIDNSQLLPFFIQLCIDQIESSTEAVKWTGFMMVMVGILWYRAFLGRNHLNSVIGMLYFALQVQLIIPTVAHKVSTCIALASYGSGHPKAHELQMVGLFLAFMISYPTNMLMMVLFVVLVSILRSIPGPWSF